MVEFLQLHPAVPVLRRSDGRIQVGVVDPLLLADPSLGPVLAALRRGQRLADLAGLAADASITPDALADLLAALGDRCQPTPRPLPLHRRWPVPRTRSLCAHARLAERLARDVVLVSGDGPIAAGLVAVLAASGVRRIRRLPDPTRLDEAVTRPGRDEPAPPEFALRHPTVPGAWPACEHEIARRHTLRLLGPVEEPQAAPAIAVVVREGPPHPLQWRPLLRDDVPHLSVSTEPDGAVVVGPLVRPGVTGCLGCADQHARDRDPDHALVCDQRWRHPGAAPAPADVAIACGLAARTLLDAESDVSDGAVPLPVAVRDGALLPRAHAAHPRCLCRDPA
jgi:hypothetical protein